ncbi:hypothetical protein ABGB17_20265 [Sphaerisporangium sp. B11E5]|uniref:hypothetical protein n=1 Tax=Sphaerisporangium sp. B11E5 TaxID=3153563 RepID=UPI00325F4539
MNLNVVHVPGLTESQVIVYGPKSESMIILSPDPDMPTGTEGERIEFVFKQGLRAGLELGRSIAHEFFGPA